MTHNVQLQPATRRLLYGWLMLAVIAAGVAGIFALMVTLGRIPALEFLSDARAFELALVGHVAFALTIWVFSFMGALWVYAGALVHEEQLFSLRLGRFALGVSIAGAAILGAGILASSDQAAIYLTDYVVVLDSALFHTGYATFAAGVLLTALNFLLTAFRREFLEHPVAVGMLAAAACSLVAALSISVAWLTLRNAPDVARFRHFQALFFGWGHALQYAYVAAMAASWLSALVGMGVVPRGRHPWQLAFLLYALLVLPTPLLYPLLGPARVPQVEAVGILLSEGLALPTLLLVGVIGFMLWQRRRGFDGQWRKHLWQQPTVSAALCSLFMFGLGGLLQPAGSQGTLRVPAHYHAMVVGGVTMAFMGLAYHLVKVVGRSLYSQTLARVQPYLFGPGVLALVAGMAWAGALGAPRKTFEAGVAGVSWLAPTNLLGAGAVVTALGGSIFVFNVLVSLIITSSTEAPRRQSDARQVPSAPDGLSTEARAFQSPE